MKRWTVAFLLTVLACVPIFLARSSSPDLLKDSDTAVLIHALNQRHAPLSWFSGDWPLQNHFYRPVSTLAFELDNAIHPNDPAGFGMTNDLLAIACVLLLFWFFRELTDRPMVAFLASALFAFWVAGVFVDPIASCFGYAAGIAALVCAGCLVAALLRSVSKRDFRDQTRRAAIALSATLLLLYAGFEVDGSGVSGLIRDLKARMLEWLPGRTASVMTVFALIALAAYARFERTGATRIPAQPTALDVPATKSAQVAEPSRFAWIWAVISCLGVAVALGSYEQAVMLPAALLALATSMRIQRYQVRWYWHIAFWTLLALYLLARYELLPHGVSQYQRQQFRHSEAVLASIGDYVFPTLPPVWQVLAASGSFVELLMLGQIWLGVLRLAANAQAYYAVAKKKLAFGFAGWALSIIAFLPMAWLKPFGHYDFWPLAMRSIFVVTVCWVALDRLVSAVSPLDVQAPPRPSPAPGSLPRR